MLNRNFQENPFRAVEILQPVARSLSKSDDTFATARKIGTLRASSTPTTIRALGTLSPFDRVDVYKFTVSPGANFSSYTDLFQVSANRVKASAYVQHPDLTDDNIQFIGSRVLKGTTSLVTNRSTNNDSFDPLTLYVKVTLLGNGTTKYNFKTTYNPA